MNLLPYWVNGPPCTLSSVGYRRPGMAPAGGIAQHSTSVPSAERATNRSGSTSPTLSANGRVSLVRARSPVPSWPASWSGARALISSSPVLVGVAAMKASVPAAQSHSATHRSPPTRIDGFPVPSAGTR